MATEQDDLLRRLQSSMQQYPQTGAVQNQPQAPVVPPSGDPLLDQFRTAMAQNPQGEQKDWTYYLPVRKDTTDVPFMTGAGREIASVADLATGAIPFLAGQATYWGTRIGQTLKRGPQLPANEQQARAEYEQQTREAQARKEAVEAALSSPFGRMAGVTETPEYKQEFFRRVATGAGELLQPVGKAVSGTLEAGGVAPAEAETVTQASTLALPKVASTAKAGAQAAAQAVSKTAKPYIQATQEAFDAMRENARNRAFEQAGTFGAKSMGAAQAPDIAQVHAALSTVSPELRAVVQNIPVNESNVPTIMRHIEADSLPVPVRLTKGEATGDPVILSNERNRRGRDPELAMRMNETNQALVDNLPEIRDATAPDAHTTTIGQAGRDVIAAYKEHYKTRQTEISKAYKELQDAAGGSLPVDGVLLADNASATLARQLKTEFLSPAIKSQLEAFRSGAPMTFEQFEALRSNLAKEMRTAERAGDGNRAMAAGIVRSELEKLPMRNETAALKVIADRARSLAKQHFDDIAADPAYKAVVNGKASPRTFIENYVVNGIPENVARMVNTFGKESRAHQTVKAGVMNWLSDRAGIVDGKGNFSAANFNKGLKRLDDFDILNTLFDPKTRSQLQTLGNVSGYTQFQPRGSFINNSNTLVGALAENAANTAAAAIDVKTGLPVGSYVKRKLAERKERKQTQESLAVGAGSRRISDMANEGK